MFNPFSRGEKFPPHRPHWHCCPNGHLWSHIRDAIPDTEHGVYNAHTCHCGLRDNICRTEEDARAMRVKIMRSRSIFDARIEVFP